MLKRGLILVAAVYLGFLVLMAVGQDSLIFFPNTFPASEVDRTGKALGMVPWYGKDGAFMGWKREAVTGGRVLLVFHGNAGMALNRMPYVFGFEGVGGKVGWDVRLIEYPGYGAREGEPGEKEFQAAAEQALAAVREEAGGDSERPVYVLGESVGSGPASYLAGAHPDEVAGVFLVTPFTSMVDVARKHRPWLPVGLLLRHRFDNEAALRSYHGPVAVLLGGQDKVVTTRLGQELFDGYQGPKRLWLDAESGHNDIDYSRARPLWAEVSGFLLQPVSR